MKFVVFKEIYEMKMYFFRLMCTSIRIIEKCCIAKGNNLVICFNKLFFVMMLSDVCFNFPKQIFHFLIKGKCISTRQITQLEYKDMELLGFPISFVAKRLTLIPLKLVITCRYENYQRNDNNDIIFCTLVRFDVGLIQISNFRLK